MIKASCDSKVRQFKSHKNSVGHMIGRESGGCTDATGVCTKVCYVTSTFRYPNVMNVLKNNLSSLYECESVDDFISALLPLVEYSDTQFQRKLKNSKGKERRRLEQRGHIFRWHWAGDIISVNHAQAITEIAELKPNTSFWLYTRSWWAAGKLKAVNLDVYLSVDRENSEQMRKIAAMYSHVKIAFMTETPLGLGVVCPTTNGKLETEGACNTCGICYSTNSNVEFLIHK